VQYFLLLQKGQPFFHEKTYNIFQEVRVKVWLFIVKSQQATSGERVKKRNVLEAFKDIVRTDSCHFSYWGEREGRERRTQQITIFIKRNNEKEELSFVY